MNGLDSEISNIGSNLLNIVSYVIPGLVIYYVRIQYLSGRMPKHSETVLSYLFLSLVFYVVYYPLELIADYYLIPLIANYHPTEFWMSLIKYLGFMSRIIIGPVLFGFCLAYFERDEPLIYKLMKRFRLNPVHYIPTAWDFKFKRIKPSFVIITLKDGTVYQGYCGKKSFISYDETNRDIYIENIALNNEFDTEKPRGLYISAGEIKTIEFLA